MIATDIFKNPKNYVDEALKFAEGDVFTAKKEFRAWANDTLGRDVYRAPRAWRKAVKAEFERRI